MPYRSRWWSARSWLGAVLAAVVLATGAPAVARAQDKQAPDDSAVVQYTELVPTGGGAKAPGVGRESRSSLPPKTKKALEAAPKGLADSLAVVATSSNYGAPQGRPARPTRHKARERPKPTDELTLYHTVSAAAAAAAPIDARMVGLLVAMLATAAVGAALAIRNHRTSVRVS